MHRSDKLFEEPTLVEACATLADIARHYEGLTAPETPGAVEIIRARQAIEIVRKNLDDLQGYYESKMEIKLDWYQEQVEIWNAYSQSTKKDSPAPPAMQLGIPDPFPGFLPPQKPTRK